MIISHANLPERAVHYAGESGNNSETAYLLHKNVPFFMQKEESICIKTGAISCRKHVPVVSENCPLSCP